jgi:hypothetical protein
LIELATIKPYRREAQAATTSMLKMRMSKSKATLARKINAPQVRKKFNALMRNTLGNVQDGYLDKKENPRIPRIQSTKVGLRWMLTEFL